MHDEDQPAAGVAVGEAPAADLVQQVLRPQVRQERVVEDEAAREPDVGDREHAEEPEPRLRRECREEREHGEEGTDGRVGPEQSLADWHAVRDHADHRAGEGHDPRRDRDAEAPHRASREGDAEEHPAFAERVLEEMHEVDRQDRGDARGPGRVGPVVHAPGADDPPLRGGQVADRGQAHAPTPPAPRAAPPDRSGPRAARWAAGRSGRRPSRAGGGADRRRGWAGRRRTSRRPRRHSPRAARR